MITYKWNGRNGFIGLHEILGFAIKLLHDHGSTIMIMHFAGVFTEHLGIIIKQKNRRYHDTQHYLTQDLEPTGQSVAIAFFIVNTLLLRQSLGAEFEIVVDETNQSQPYCSEDHQTDIGFIQISQQESGNQNGEDDDETTHCWRTFFLLLTGQTQITNRFTYLLAAEILDQFFSKYRRDHQRQYHGQQYPGGNELEQGATRELHSRFDKPVCDVI